MLKPAYLERKLQNLQPRQVSLYRSIKSIEEIESVPTKCIAVESETHSYLAGKTLIPTHNTVFKQLSKWLPVAYEPLDKAIQTDNEYERGPIDVTPKPSRFDVTAQAPAGGLLGALAGEQPVGQNAEVQNVPQNQPAPQDAESALNQALAEKQAPVGYNQLREGYETENGKWDPSDALANLDTCINRTLDYVESANQQ